DEDRPAEKKPAFKAPVEQPKEGKRKKRKFKKRKQNKGLLVGVVVGGLVVLGLIVGLLVWYLGRKPAAYEMMAYLPEDASHDVGGAYGGLKVFAPTNRIVVFAQSGIRDDLFKKMLKGNAGDPEKTIIGRTGPLGKRMTRGTWWVVSDTKIVAPPPPQQQGGFG